MTAAPRIAPRGLNLPRHPRAAEALRLVRDGGRLDALGTDQSAVVASLTRGCRPPAIRPDGEGGWRLSVRGRELLALVGQPLEVVRRSPVHRVHCVAPATRQVLARALDGPVPAATLGPGVGRLAQTRLVARTPDGLWALTPRGREAATSGVTVYVARRRRRVVLGGA